MNTTSENTSSLLNRLDGINLSEVDRIVARAHAQRAECLADLVIGAARAIGAIGRSIGRGLVGLFRPRQLG